MKCFYHLDADGKCAAYWVHKRYPVLRDIDFIKMNYDSNIDWFSLIGKDEYVIIVDFSFEPDDMRKILSKTKNVVWIDHHKSAIEKYKDFGEDIKGIRYDGIAGCMLTYCYYFVMADGRTEFNENMTKSAPWMTKYIADHDVWKFEFGEETEDFKLGFDTLGPMEPTNSKWESLLEIENVRKLIENGSIIKKYRDALGERICSDGGFEFDFDGIKTFCLNIGDGLRGSEWFGDLIHKYDMICAFSFSGKSKKWIYSLYSEKIDTTPYSKKYGGGGHTGASGFHTDKLIFTQ